MRQVSKHTLKRNEISSLNFSRKIIPSKQSEAHKPFEGFVYSDYQSTAKCPSSLKIRSRSNATDLVFTLDTAHFIFLFEFTSYFQSQTLSLSTVLEEP